MSSKFSLENDVGGKLTLKNFDTMHLKIQLSIQSAYPYAGRILSKREEIIHARPDAPYELVRGSPEEMLFQAEIKEYVSPEKKGRSPLPTFCRSLAYF